MPTNQGDRQAFFRAISGTTTDYNGDFLAAAAVDSFTGEFNGVFIRWLQDRTGSSATNLDGLKQEFAVLAGAHNWESVGGVPIILPGCQLWLKSNDRSTVIQSSNSVSQWIDKSGKGNNTNIQGTGSKQPTTNATTLNNENVLDFDGGDVLLANSNLFEIPNSAYTLFIVAVQATQATERLMTWTVSGSSKTNMFYPNSANIGFFSNLSFDSITQSATTTNFNIFHFRRSGTTQAVSVNGAAEASETTASDVTGSDGLGIGASATNADPLNGSIAEIIVYDRSLSIAEITAVNNYLSPEWGITLA